MEYVKCVYTNVIIQIGILWAKQNAADNNSSPYMKYG